MTDAVRAHMVASDSARLAVTERGAPDRPTVVLVHGWPDSSEVWTPVADRLVDRFHVVTFDARGVGRSTVAPGVRKPYDLIRMADDIDAVCRAVSAQPVHLVGHDWGGMQGWEYVGDPDREPHVASFTAISGPCLDHVAHWVRDRLRHPSPDGVRQVAGQAARSTYTVVNSVPGLRRALWRMGMAPSFRRWMVRVEGVPAEQAYPGPSLAEDAMAAVPLYRTNLVPRMRRPQERRARVPVQLIVNQQDRYVGSALFDDADRWAPDLTRRDLDAGHWSVRTHPDDVARCIADHVDAVEARRTPASA
jgi:pimeloyl-ACP methyl ester carboxylesterase